MFVILYREHGDPENTWREDGRYEDDDRDAAVKKYAMRLKKFGTANVLFVFKFLVNCICVDVLLPDGEKINSQ